MNQNAQLITTSFVQALQELKANKLRTFLSLLGITIGIFCIIAVLTVLDSLQNNFQNNLSSLGSDVLYVSRKPWMGEDGEFKWWEYLRRQPLSENDLNYVQRHVQGVKYATICNGSRINVKYEDQEVTNVVGYAVSENFDRIQNVEVVRGRYMGASDLNGGTEVALIGDELYKSLMPPGANPLGKVIVVSGKRLSVIGLLKKSGANMAGFNFDNAIIYPYRTAATMMNVNSLDWSNDPLLMIKGNSPAGIEDLKLEVEGALRTNRKVGPNEKNNFAINQLSQIATQINAVFATVDIVGAIIAFFSLLVGGFGVANIMFVTVKERTKFIGLKKALGARPSLILKEFLVEAITLCVIGGLLGIAIVFLLSIVVTFALDFPITFSFKNFAIGVSVSGIVGVLAGYIPARAAARLDPVVAIRTT